MKENRLVVVAVMKEGGWSVVSEFNGERVEVLVKDIHKNLDPAPYVEHWQAWADVLNAAKHKDVRIDISGATPKLANSIQVPSVMVKQGTWMELKRLIAQVEQVKKQISRLMEIANGFEIS